MNPFIIAEAACTWLHGGLEAAYRSIRESKACGADAWKTQWTSDPVEMHKRRGIEGDHYKRLAWPIEWLSLFKAECDRVGIEFMCTVYIPKDIGVIASLVKRFKVSAFESKDDEFLRAYDAYTSPSRLVIVSYPRGYGYFTAAFFTQAIYCVSKYPTPLEHLGLDVLLSGRDCESPYCGLSDHTESTLTGAVAVGAGASILEKHVKLWDTSQDDPDWKHSLYLDADGGFEDGKSFYEYVRLARQAAVMM